MTQTRLLLTGLCEALWRGRKDSWLFPLVEKLLPLVDGKPDPTLASLLNAFAGAEPLARDVPLHCVLEEGRIPESLDALTAGAICVMPERLLNSLTASATSARLRGELMVESGGGLIAAYFREPWFGARLAALAGQREATALSVPPNEDQDVAGVSDAGVQIEIGRDSLHEISCCIARPAEGVTRLRVEQSGRLDQSAIAISKGVDVAASATWPVSVGGHLPISYDAGGDGVVVRFLVWLETGRRTRVRITHAEATEAVVPAAYSALTVRALSV